MESTRVRPRPIGSRSATGEWARFTAPALVGLVLLACGDGSRAVESGLAATADPPPVVGGSLEPVPAEQLVVPELDGPVSVPDPPPDAGILTLLIDGRILAGDDVLYWPGSGAGVSRLVHWLRQGCEDLPHATAADVTPEGYEPPFYPREVLTASLRIRADRNARAEDLVRIVRAGVGLPRPLWRFSVAARLPETRDEAWVRLECPDAAFSLPRLGGRMEVTPRPARVGVKLHPTGEPFWSGWAGTRFEYDSSRTLEYHLGPRRVRGLPDLQEALDRWCRRSVEKLGGDWDRDPLVLLAWDGITVGECVDLAAVGLRAGWQALYLDGYVLGL